MQVRAATLTLALVASYACGAPPDAPGDGRTDGASAAGTTQRAALGPVDGHDLPGTDLDRVQVGQSAPEFTLASLAGPPVTLSDYRGEKNVVLVFYRGHW